MSSPLRTYAMIELAIGVSGCAVVGALPEFAEALAPIFRLAGEIPALQNLLRFAFAFVLLLVPTTLMGMTLPVIVTAGYSVDANFGSVLGRLYGWNTVGGIGGVLAAEGLLVTHLGMRATGWVAACENLVAAIVATMLARSPRAVARPPVSRSASARLVLVTSFLCGAILLALEVVWFRFFLLFFNPFGWTFALMLGTVLAGIATGGFSAALWFRHRLQALGVGPVAALASGGLQCLILLALAARARQSIPSPSEMVALMFPTASFSGVLFTVCGRALDLRRSSAIHSTGEVTGANTLGSAFGAALGGLFFVPVLGIERSFFVLSVAYGIVALLLLRASWDIARPHSTATIGAAVIFVAGLVAFPWGSVEAVFLARPGSFDRALSEDGFERIAFREGTNETIRYLRLDLLDHPYRYQLLTNNFSMSGTSIESRRYMKYYVYWPEAVNPDARDALLISYGVGSTAKALTDTAPLERIDVVDISRDVLDLSSIVYPDPKQNPLNDPRVRVIVEDGRFHLQTTDQQYDLITAEPPPLRTAGVQNLYSREFFELARRRLRAGGVVTYWLPVHELLMNEAKSVVRGFCDAFPDCSLWAGTETHWMLVGMRDPRPAPSEEAFARQWRTPRVADEMRRLGFPDPESFGAFFIADGPRLEAWLGSAPPLTDDRPGRIAPYSVRVPGDTIEGYIEFQRSPDAARSFGKSKLVERIWPARLRQDALERFETGRRLSFLLRRGPTYENVHAALTTPELRGVIPWAFGSDEDALRIVDGVVDLEARRSELATDERVHPHLVARAVVAGKLEEAIDILDTAIERQWTARRHVLERSEHLRLYFLATLGERDRCEKTLRILVDRLGASAQSVEPTARFVAWLAGVFPELHISQSPMPTTAAGGRSPFTHADR